MESLRRVQAGEIAPEDIDEAMLGAALYTEDQPPVDLIIRPSGEYRLSNFLLYQGAYSELYFSDVLWPDFDEKEFDKAMESFSTRKRRFGKV